MRGLRTKRIRTVKEGTLIVAVDVGMTSNTGYCTTIDGRDTKVFKFGNTREGFDKLWSMAVATRNKFECTEVTLGYESTGPYAEPLFHYLMDKPVKIVQVNPMHTKKMKELNDNSPLKTDDKDPRVIADIIKLGHALSVLIPESTAAYLQRLNNASVHSGNSTLKGNILLNMRQTGSQFIDKRCKFFSHKERLHLRIMNDVIESFFLHPGIEWRYLESPPHPCPVNSGIFQAVPGKNAYPTSPVEPKRMEGLDETVYPTTGIILGKVDPLRPINGDRPVQMEWSIAAYDVHTGAYLLDAQFPQYEFLRHDSCSYDGTEYRTMVLSLTLRH